MKKIWFFCFFTFIGGCTLLQAVDYANEIQPIFNADKANCIMCHSGSGSNNLNLTSYDNLMDGNSNNGPVVTAGDADNSILI